MKQSRYTESQTFQRLQILKEAEAGVPAAEFCRKYEIGNATFYKWRAKFGGMDTASMKRLKELEEENARLKNCMPMRDSRLRCYQRSLKKVVKPSRCKETAKRAVVEFGLSVRQACR